MLCGVHQIKEVTRLSTIDTVLFDLDQTLFNKDQSLINFAKVQYARFSLHQFIPDEYEFIDTFKQLNNIVMSKEHVYTKLIEHFNIDHDLYDSLLEDLNHHFHLYSVGFHGLHEMLRTLKQSGYQLGIVTNGREFYQRNKMNALGITEFFHDIVISGAVNLRKPDHAIFQLALSHLRSTAKRAVFIGDNLQADIMPAKALGMRTILKSNDHSSLYPDAICNDLTEIPYIIRNLA